MATVKASAREAPGEQTAIKDGKVYRFGLASRLAHWNHALTFLLLLFTGLGLVVRGISGLAGAETLRLFGQLHRLAAIPFTVLTIPILLIGARRATARWLREVFRFDRDDLRFFPAFVREFFGLKAESPPQGKFNAGEKVNSILQIVGWPTMAVTGWMLVYKTSFPPALMQWVILIHSGMAMLLGCAVLGHIYLATLMPGFREGLSGMLSGWVPAKWAKDHYRKWYREITGE
ncbi:formate dehydrogenase subunit gamma [Symbiobacterium thermophilum]|uniref:formate dehydrogenase subunit gamma n=1 Tax=Symbiobacterium thermophilum TaxID=2734 RepID=UPI0002F24F0A|nr:cytochrome b/b6 domain-containing protein [Symbiobacterium thermophilum]